MNTSESLGKILPDLFNAQGEIKNLAPNKSGYGYNYVDLAEIIDNVKPILLKNSIIVIQSVGTAEGGVSITTRLQHISGEWIQDTFALPALVQKSMNSVQGMGASITYGRRYGISAMLGIATDEDTDGAMKNKQHNKQPEKPFDPKLAEKKIDELMQKLAFPMEYREQIHNQFEKAKTKADYTAIYKAVELEGETL